MAGIVTPLDPSASAQRGRDDWAARRLLRPSLAVAAALALYACYGIASQAIVLGSREGRWVYGYLQPLGARTAGVALLAAALAWGLLAAAGRAGHRREWPLVVSTVGAALLLQALIRSLTPFTFEAIFVSDGANSFYGVTRRFYPDTVLANFGELRADWPLHAQSNMPGKLMLVYALRELSRRPDVLAWLVVVVSNLGAIFMYAFVRDLFGDRRAAFFALVLYLFVPGKLFFFPLLNTVTPVIVLACSFLLLRWLRTSRVFYAGLLGMALYLLVFYEPLPLVTGVVFAGLAAAAVWQGPMTARRLFGQGVVAVLGFALTYAFVYLRFGFELLGAFREIAAHAVAFNEQAGRPYDIWIRENLREFAFGIGIAQVVLFWAALADGLRGEASSARLTRPVVVLCLTLLATVLATDLIGVNRGEVIRLWIFLACLYQIPAAYVCARLQGQWAIGVVLAVTILQGALGTAMIGFILPG